RVLIIPGDGVVARVVHLVALDHHALEPRRGAAVGADRGLAVVADLVLAAGDVGQRLRLAAPAADVVVLDHHVGGAGGQADGVVLGALQRQAADDHVLGRDLDVVGRRVGDVDRGRAGVEDVRVLGAALGDLQRGRAVLHLHGLADREGLRPGAGVDAGGEAAADAHLDRVVGAGREVHDAAAALAVTAVVPHRIALLPRGFSRLAVADAAGAAGRRGARLPVHAERLERRHALRVGRRQRGRVAAAGRRGRIAAAAGVGDHRVVDGD